MLIPIVTGLYGALLAFLQEMRIKDLIEIAAISYAFYLFLLWTAQDKEHKLIYYCYGYLGLIMLSYLWYLPVLFHLLTLFLPVALVILITLNQAVFQKNFVSLRPVISASKRIEPADWIEVVIRAAMKALNQKRTVYFVIQNQQSLESFLENSCSLHAEATKQFFDLIIDSAQQPETFLLLLRGFIVSIAPSWKDHSIESQEQAVVLSSQTDAVIIYTHYKKNGLTVIAQGIVTENISAHQATLLLKHHCKSFVTQEQKNEK